MWRGLMRIFLSRCDVITFMLQTGFTVEVVLQGHCGGYASDKTYTCPNLIQSIGDVCRWCGVQFGTKVWFSLLILAVI